MKLKKREQLIFKVLIYLAINRKTIDIKNIATDLNESYDHVKKIIQFLSKNNYIQSTRGRNGGVKLTKEPQEIEIYQVMKLFHILEVGCDESQCQKCDVYDLCKLRKIIYLKESKYIEEFKGIYLKDIIM